MITRRAEPRLTAESVRRVVTILPFVVGSMGETACHAKPEPAPKPLPSSSYAAYFPPPTGTDGKPVQSEIQIDAMTGRIKGSQRLAKKTRTRVSLVQINPFMFQYRTKITATAVL